MSNIDVVKRCIDAISQRDVATLKELSAPDVEVKPLRAMLEDTVYRGTDGVDQWLRDLQETWAELRIEVEAIREPEPGHVIAEVMLHGRGHGSNAPTTMPVALVSRLRDGLVWRASVEPVKSRD